MKEFFDSYSTAPSKSDTDKALYLINDKYNSFDHVINCLVSICEHGNLQAEQCALITHYNGACEIASGKKQDLIDLRDDLLLYGLNVEIF
tara:strand:+ start:115 stop:384 length:270 start_codon:yes stop_codon:yes gene_type:complete